MLKSAHGPPPFAPLTGSQTNIRRSHLPPATAPTMRERPALAPEPEPSDVTTLRLTQSASDLLQSVLPTGSSGAPPRQTVPILPAGDDQARRRQIEDLASRIHSSYVHSSSHYLGATRDHPILIEALIDAVDESRSTVLRGLRMAGHPLRSGRQEFATNVANELLR